MLEDVRIVGRGASVDAPVIEREVEAVDLKSLGLARPKADTALKTIRDSHHALARMTAEGRPVAEISAISGYTYSRVNMLQQDPAFQELVEFYRVSDSFEYASLVDRMKDIALDTAQEIHARLNDNPDAISLDELHNQFKIMADRTGHGPQSRSTNVHIHAGFAERLEAARQRVRPVLSLPAPAAEAEE